jgi:hypothetical protein
MSFPSEDWFRVLFEFDESIEAVNKNFVVTQFSDTPP